MSFLILHGLEGNDEGHWQTWLADRLRERGLRVLYPELPDPFEPELEEWLDVIDGEYAATVVCHSLGCLLWLHHVARGGWTSERVLLVAPPCAEVPGASGFQPPPFPELGEGALLAASGDDPWCPPGAATAYAELAVATVELPGAGHVNTEAGYGPWPGALAWCLGEGPPAALSSR